MQFVILLFWAILYVKHVISSNFTNEEYEKAVAQITYAVKRSDEELKIKLALWKHIKFSSKALNNWFETVIERNFDTEVFRHLLIEAHEKMPDYISPQSFNEFLERVVVNSRHDLVKILLETHNFFQISRNLAFKLALNYSCSFICHKSVSTVLELAALKEVFLEYDVAQTYLVVVDHLVDAYEDKSDNAEKIPIKKIKKLLENYMKNTQAINCLVKKLCAKPLTMYDVELLDPFINRLRPGYFLMMLKLSVDEALEKECDIKTKEKLIEFKERLPDEKI